MSTDKLVSKSDLQEFYNRILPYLGGTAEAGFTPVGTVISVMGKTAPANYLPCDGRVVNISDYPELADYFKEQFGSSNYFGGDGTTTFGIVDLSGEFLRGAGTNSHTNQGNGGEVGEHQDSTEVLRMWSTNTPKQLRIRIDSSSLSTVLNEDSTTIRQTSQEYLPSTTVQASESSYVGVRPTNTSVLFCIATKNIYLNPSLDFSTSEKVVGTWIDGKPIYQRTLKITNLTTTQTKTDLSSYNIEQIINCSGVCSQTDGSIVPFPRGDVTNITNCYFWYYNTSSKFIIAKGSTAPELNYVYVTLQYTKTTD